ncbi:MAG: OmpA family protein [Rheinheimera sp.]|nr:OmpA family protein [Rheinheimera sp.]
MKLPLQVTLDNDQVSDELNSTNWELSAKRTVSVAVELMSGTGLDKNRLVVVGHADTRPIVPNNTEQNRRRNRRVEISIMQGKAKESVSNRTCGNQGSTLSLFGRLYFTGAHNRACFFDKSVSMIEFIC